ncbi:hypothetical protein C8R43DRAFT_322115 [Mycena crocata]|nr:hypothetical protein C8R43DRAFT_322115 [Mycena crocata]
MSIALHGRPPSSALLSLLRLALLPLHQFCQATMAAPDAYGMRRFQDGYSGSWCVSRCRIAHSSRSSTLPVFRTLHSHFNYLPFFIAICIETVSRGHYPPHSLILQSARAIWPSPLASSSYFLFDSHCILSQPVPFRFAAQVS